MYTKEMIISKLMEIKPKLLERYPICELGLFGSYASGENKSNSDIDILVDFNQAVGIGFIHLAHDLEDAFNIKVDLVSRRGIKAKYLHSVEKNLIHV